LAKRTDELEPEALALLPPEIQTATTTFHQFWTAKWQNFVETSDSVDVVATMVAQASRCFGMAMEVEALFKTLQKKNREFVSKASQAEEQANKSKAEVEASKKKEAEESAKLASALAEIEALKKEVHLSQSEVASLTKRVETSDAHQKIAAEALERANKEKEGLTGEVKELTSQFSKLREEIEGVRSEAERSKAEAEDHFLANFHLTEKYQQFALYWRRYAYTEVVEWIEVHSTQDTSELRAEFLDEGQEGSEPPTPLEEPQVIELDEDVSPEVAPDAIVPFVDPRPPPQ
jgi:chromosome segregation ATPase